MIHEGFELSGKKHDGVVRVSAFQVRTSHMAHVDHSS